MTAVELEEKRDALWEQLNAINKEIREKKIEETYAEKGDILKDKWIKVGSLLFYSKGCTSSAKAYDTREFIEGNTDTMFFLLEFYGFRLMFHDIRGIVFADFDDMSGRPGQKDVIRLKMNKHHLRGDNFQIINKNDLKEVNKIANENLLLTQDNFVMSASNSICKVTINPNVKIEYCQ